MSQQKPEDPPQSESAKGKVAEGGSTLPPAVAGSVAGEPPPTKPLTPEEQMALYEKDLKENDWGHQPC